MNNRQPLPGLLIEPLKADDWPAIRAIYQQGIDGGNATFEKSAPTWEEWDASHLPHSRLVARKEGRVVGWAALSGVSGRCAYAGVAEVSVYIDASAQRQGVGRALLRALIAESERHGIWTLQASIFKENLASLALHRSCRFRQVGIRERLGQRDGIWRDVILLERRSQVVGID